MIKLFIFDFGAAGVAIGEIRNAPYGWLTVTQPLARGESLDWVDLNRLLYQHDVITPIS